MKPRLDAGDLLVYYRLDKEASAGDVICFVKNGTTYAGRVAAVGGDRVEITEEESLKINDSVMIEQEIFYPTPRYEGFTDYPLEVPAGSFLFFPIPVKAARTAGISAVWTKARSWGP